jgi:signal transduction histidine kinase
MNLTKNAVEAGAKRMVIRQLKNSGEGASTERLHVKMPVPQTLYIGNNGLPIPAENRQSLFVPFFTTKRSGSGIRLSLSRRLMIQQGGMLDLSEKQWEGCRAGFLLTILRRS